MQNIHLSTIKETYLPKVLIGILLAITVVIVGYLGSITWQNIYPPQLISSAPANNSPKVSPFAHIVFTFDRPLSDSVKQSFSTSPSIKGELLVNGKQLQFIPTAHLDFGQRFEVNIKSPAGNWGVKGADVKITFTTKNRSELSPDEASLLQGESDTKFNQEVQQASQSQQYQKDQAILRFVQSTPYETDTFLVEYFHTSNSFYVTIKKNPYQQNKDAAVAWIKSLGVIDLGWINVSFGSFGGVKP